MSNQALNRAPSAPVPSGQAEVIHVPNALRTKVGPRFGGIDPSAIAKAEAALKELSSQFGQWLQDEINKLEEARAQIRTHGMSQPTAEALYTHAHDLKGLGTTYEFPLISRIAGSLCTLMSRPEKRASAPLFLVDAHIDAIRAAVRDNIRSAEHPVGKILAEELERRVLDYARTEAGASPKP
jgi:chemotaxis protein histidine kinase CheA